MLTKNRVLIISGILSALLIIWDQIGNYQLCDYFVASGSLGYCPFTLTDAAMVLFPIFALFLLSLITYFMREEVFRFWVKFAIPATIVSMILIFLTPNDTGGGFGPQISIGKGDTALATSALFILISLVLIGYKYWALKRNSR